MPCKELAPYLAATAPSARALDSILAYAGRDTAAAVAATKHAGCREAAGLSLLEMLLAAIREGGSSAEAAPKPSARAVVLQRTSDIGAAVVSLVTDASVVRGHCPPDIRTAGVDCFRALQTLDGTAAGAAYKQLEAGIDGFKDALSKGQLSTLPLRELRSIPVEITYDDTKY